MNNLKRIIAVFSAASILGSGVVMASPFSDVADNAAYKDAILRLSGLGIIEGSNGMFRPDDGITRAETAKILEYILGYGNITSTTKNQFADVDSSKWYASIVNLAANIGIMQGYTKGKKQYVLPESSVTFAQFATMALRELGYRDKDLKAEKWPDNYVDKAKEIGLFNGINNFAVNGAAKRSEVAAMANNMLNTPPASEAARTAPKTFFDLFKDKLKVSVLTGVITATPAIAPTLAQNHVEIDGTDYEVSAYNYQDVLNNLGKTATVYLKDNKITFIGDVKGNSTNVTLSKDITAQAAVYNNGAQEVTLPIDKNVKFVVNGRKAKNLSIIKAGANVTLINNNDSPEYDFMIVSEESSPIISNKDVTTDDPVAVSDISGMSLKKVDGTGAAVTVTGDVYKLSDIKKNDLLYPTLTEDNSIVKLNVLRKKISGIVTAVTYPADGKLGTATVNSSVYNVSPNVAVNVTDNKDFILDRNNIIVGAVDRQNQQPISSALNFGIIVNKSSVLYSNQVAYSLKFMNLDGTSTDIVTNNSSDFYTFANRLVYYTKDNNNMPVFHQVNYDKLKTINIVPDTQIYEIKSGNDKKESKIFKVNASDVRLTDDMYAYYITNPNSTLGDYSTIAVVDPQEITTDTSSYGYMLRKVGSVLVGNDVVDTYSVIINGQQKNVNVQKDVVIPQQFSKLIYNNGTVIDALAVPQQNIIAGKYKTSDTQRIKIDNSLYYLDVNCKVYNTKTSSVVPMSVLATDDSITAIKTDANQIVMIMVNK